MSVPFGRRSTDRPEHRARVLEAKRGNLEKLELQAASYSPIDVPLEVQNGIEQLKADIAALEAANEPQGPSDEVIDILGPVGQYKVLMRIIMQSQADILSLRNDVRDQRRMLYLALLVIILALVAVEVWR